MTKRTFKIVRVLCMVIASVFAFSISAFAESQVCVRTVVPETHTITVTADGAEVYLDGNASNVFTVKRLSQPEFMICPDEDCAIKKVTFNGADVTAYVTDGRYTAEPIYCDSILLVETSDAKNSSGPTDSAPTGTTVPKTGDRTSSAPWITLLLMSCGGIAGVTLKAHRAKKRTS